MSEFKASFRGIGEVLRSPAMEAEMKRRADKVAARAEATAPFDPGSKDGTHYKDSFKVESGVSPTLKRAYGRVTNDDAAALWLEVGTRDTPKFRTMGKALDAAKD